MLSGAVSKKNVQPSDPQLLLFPNVRHSPHKKWGPSMQASILCSRLVFLRRGRKVAALSSESMHLTGPTPNDSARYRLGSDDCFSFKYEIEEPSMIINNVVLN